MKGVKIQPMTSNLKTRVPALMVACFLLCQCAADRFETVADTKTADGKLKGELAVSAHAFRLTLTNTSPNDVLVDKNGRYCIRLFLTAGARRWWTKDFIPLPHVHSAPDAIRRALSGNDHPLKDYFTTMAPGESKTYTYSERDELFGVEEEYPLVSVRPMPAVNELSSISITYDINGLQTPNPHFTPEEQDKNLYPEKAYKGTLKLHWKIDKAENK